jgi:hypothetical protein
MKVLTEDYSPYVDKIKAKEIVKNTCSEMNIAKIIKIIDKPNDFTKDDINPDHIIKSTHASRWNFKITKNTTIKEVHLFLNTCNKQYYPNISKQYSFIKPKFFIEEIIDDKNYGKSGDAIAYGFYCLYGKIQFIRIDDPKCKYVNMYDKDWNLKSPNYMNRIFTKPQNYSSIVNMISILSRPFEFVRFDIFIAVDDKIYFSEYTFTPNGGKKYKTPIDNGFIDEWI